MFKITHQLNFLPFHRFTHFYGQRKLLQRVLNFLQNWHACKISIVDCIWNWCRSVMDTGNSNISKKWNTCWYVTEWQCGYQMLTVCGTGTVVTVTRGHHQRTTLGQFIPENKYFYTSKYFFSTSSNYFYRPNIIFWTNKLNIRRVIN